MERITLFLSTQEMDALESIAAMELRGFREQARLIIRQELERRGLLSEKHDGQKDDAPDK